MKRSIQVQSGGACRSQGAVASVVKVSIAVLAFMQLLHSTVSAQQQPRERVSFNTDWRFTKDDPADAGESLSYTNIKAWVTATGAEFVKNTPLVARPDANLGDNIGYTKADFDDSGWRKLNLPHDWGIEGPFKQEYPGETGKLPWWGVGWYRKHFAVPASDAGRRLYLEMDGAMAYANVWLNGQYVGGWPYGYASWQLDLTPFIKLDADNVIAIRLDNPPNSSRWYPGGGIYRNVWLTKTSPIHINQWGTQVTTPAVTASAATIQVNVEVKNHLPQRAGQRVTVRTKIYELDSKGAKRRNAAVELTAADVSITPGGTASASITGTFPKPKLWSITHPNLYAAVTTIENRGQVVDASETTFGIRTIEFTATNGFLLNGERVPIQGVCDHHDLGALGSAINARALQRQLEILKEMGVNAIRTSHNPPAPELLDLCDRMGFVVMDEAFDCWKARKKPNDYHLLFPDWHEKDLRAMVRRDRNHPSIVLWSIGNEISEQRNAAGIELAKELAGIVRDEDSTRYVTAGCNQETAGFNGFQNVVDAFGYNYKPHLYARFRGTNENIPLYGSETASTISSRGEYFFPVVEDKLQGKADFQMSSYDLYAPRWATTPDTEFRGQDENPFVAGEFVWTGFDYLGEPTPYNSDLSNLINYSDPADKARAERELQEVGKIRTPSRSSYFGIVDLAGFKKDRFYLYQSGWRPDLRMAHILPHWNWPERVGQVTPVFVYTSGDEAELFLNGKSLGRKKKGQYEYRLRWDDVKYEPGTLKVVAYKNGRKWATEVMKTTGPAAKLVAQTDRDKIAADGKDLSFITVAITDKHGLTVPRSKNAIRFSIEGPGEIVATDNGDPTSFEPFQSPDRKAFNGLALVIVRAKPGQTGKIILTAESEGLKTATEAVRSH